MHLYSKYDSLLFDTNGVYKNPILIDLPQIDDSTEIKIKAYAYQGRSEGREELRLQLENSNHVLFAAKKIVYNFQATVVGRRIVLSGINPHGFDIDVYITDLMGRNAYHAGFKEIKDKIIIDPIRLPAGLYIIGLKQQKFSIFKKIWIHG